MGDSPEDGKEPVVPGELQLLWEIERWGALPWGGGLLNQPHLTMMLLNIAANVRNESKESKAMAEEEHARQASALQTNYGVSTPKF